MSTTKGCELLTQMEHTLLSNENDAIVENSAFIWNGEVHFTGEVVEGMVTCHGPNVEPIYLGEDEVRCLIEEYNQ